VWGKRVGALLVAVALVAGALLLRRNVIEGSDDDTDTTTASTSAPSAPADAIVCASELEAACVAIADADPDRDVVIEPAGVTLDRLAALDDDADAPVWLTIAPFPAMVDELRAAASSTPLNAAGEALAASQLSVATPAGGRSATLDTACAGAPLWRCIGEHAGEPWTAIGGEESWNTVRPSLGAVEREAVALASFADAVAGYFGNPQISSTSFSDPAFIAWLRQLTGPVDESQLSAGTPLATMAVRPPLDVAATTEAERTAAGGDRFDVNYPDPTMWVEAVLAVPEGVSVPDDVAATAAEALAASGWSDPSSAAQPVPSASTMLALRSLWGQL
jgi:hypothetical protein